MPRGLGGGQRKRRAVSRAGGRRAGIEAYADGGVVPNSLNEMLGQLGLSGGVAPRRRASPDAGDSEQRRRAEERAKLNAAMGETGYRNYKNLSGMQRQRVAEAMANPTQPRQGLVEDKGGLVARYMAPTPMPAPTEPTEPATTPSLTPPAPGLSRDFDAAASLPGGAQLGRDSLPEGITGMANGGWLGGLFRGVPRDRAKQIDAAVEGAAAPPAKAAPAPQPEERITPTMAEIMADIRAKNPPIKYASGGLVDPRLGPPGTDTIPAAVKGRGLVMLDGGEYVLPKDTTRKLGVDKLNRLVDATHKPRGLADGGWLGGLFRGARGDRAKQIDDAVNQATGAPAPAKAPAEPAAEERITPTMAEIMADIRKKNPPIAGYAEGGVVYGDWRPVEDIEKTLQERRQRAVYGQTGAHVPQVSDAEMRARPAPITRTTEGGAYVHPSNQRKPIPAPPQAAAQPETPPAAAEAQPPQPAGSRNPYFDAARASFGGVPKKTVDYLARQAAFWSGGDAAVAGMRGVANALENAAPARTLRGWRETAEAQRAALRAEAGKDQLPAGNLPGMNLDDSASSDSPRYARGGAPQYDYVPPGERPAPMSPPLPTPGTAAAGPGAAAPAPARAGLGAPPAGAVDARSRPLTAADIGRQYNDAFRESVNRMQPGLNAYPIGDGTTVYASRGDDGVPIFGSTPAMATQAGLEHIRAAGPLGGSLFGTPEGNQAQARGDILRRYASLPRDARGNLTMTQREAEALGFARPTLPPLEERKFAAERADKAFDRGLKVQEVQDKGLERAFREQDAQANRQHQAALKAMEIEAGWTVDQRKAAQALDKEFAGVLDGFAKNQDNALGGAGPWSDEARAYALRAASILKRQAPGLTTAELAGGLYGAATKVLSADQALAQAMEQLGEGKPSARSRALAVELQRASQQMADGEVERMFFGARG